MVSGIEPETVLREQHKIRKTARTFLTITRGQSLMYIGVPSASAFDTTILTDFRLHACTVTIIYYHLLSILKEYYQVPLLLVSSNDSK